jgi:molybdopterin-guanine dinucleotide biosynthesis protein A
MNGVTGVILAGGASRRMKRNKALLNLGARLMIEVIAGRLRALAAEVIIAANDTQRYAPFADRCVADIFADVGTLGGIHSGLQAAANDLAIVVGCDMPFLDPNILAWFVKAAEGVDAVVLKQGKWLEPLHAVYRTSCLPAIESAIRAGQRQAFCFYPQVRVRYVTPAEIAHLDPNLRSFCNVNTPEEWQAIAALSAS